MKLHAVCHHLWWLRGTSLVNLTHRSVALLVVHPVSLQQNRTGECAAVYTRGGLPQKFTPDSPCVPAEGYPYVGKCPRWASRWASRWSRHAGWRPRSILWSMPWPAINRTDRDRIAMIHPAGMPKDRLPPAGPASAPRAMMQNWRPLSIGGSSQGSLWSRSQSVIDRRPADRSGQSRTNR